MVEVKQYKLPPTSLIPNNPFPLLHYPNLLTKKRSDGSYDPAEVYDTFTQHGWQVQWIFRYGPTQVSHYHSHAHEVMAVLTGSATIRFGVADTSDDLEESTHGRGKETGGIEVQANAGDVFVLPAGTAHKTFDTAPAAPFALLTPGDGQGIDANEPRKTLDDIELDGFTMLGAYPSGSKWDFAVGKEDDGRHFREVWEVQKPELDPVLGDAREGLVGLWVAEDDKAKLACSNN